MSIVSLLKNSLEKNAANVVPVFATLLASTNASIKSAADGLWEQTLGLLDPSFTIPPIANSLIFSNIKVKACIIMKLIDFLPELAQQNQNLITKSLMPSIVKLLDDNKADVRVPTQKLLICIYGEVQNAIYDCVPSNKVKAIRDIIGH